MMMSAAGGCKPLAGARYSRLFNEQERHPGNWPNQRRVADHATLVAVPQPG